MEPEDRVSESESMTGIMCGGARGYCVRARGYDRSYGVELEDMVSEPEDITEIMGWSQRILCQSQRI